VPITCESETDTPRVGAFPKTREWGVGSRTSNAWGVLPAVSGESTSWTSAARLLAHYRRRTRIRMVAVAALVGAGLAAPVQRFSGSR